MDKNEVYYKIYKSKMLGGKLMVLCLQWFDEKDYELERFFKDKEGNILKFCDESEAIQWLISNIKEELVDPNYLQEKILNDSEYYK